MLSPLLTRANARAPHAAAATTRLEICPPGTAKAGLARRLVAWLRGPWPESPVPCDERITLIRDEFHAELDDIRTIEAGLLKSRIDCCAGLRELWHLRAAIFGLVSRHRSQHEAECRLTRLNRHFPTRSPRSGLAPFDRLAEPDTRNR